MVPETCLAVQWSRLCLPVHRAVGSISGWEAKVPQAKKLKHPRRNPRNNIVTDLIKTLKMVYLRKKITKIVFKK